MAATTPTRLRVKQTRAAVGAAPVRAKIDLTYPARLITEPFIDELGRQFARRTDGRGANASDTMGAGDEIDRGIAWLRRCGVTVEPIEKNVVE